MARTYTSRINAVVTPIEMDEATRLADRQGITLSELMRRALRDYLADAGEQEPRAA